MNICLIFKEEVNIDYKRKKIFIEMFMNKEGKWNIVKKIIYKKNKMKEILIILNKFSSHKI